MSGILMAFVGGTYGRRPDAPTIGTASYVDRNTASVTYTAPADTGGAAITSYTATASPGGVSATVFTSASGSITVPGLSPYIPYTFTVTATSILGTSTPSAASNSVTLYGPGQVEYTTAGTYYWTAPINVTSVCVVAVGGGGSNGLRGTTGYAVGGGGGGLGWKNNIPVTPGQTYLVQVGWGAGDPAFSNGNDPQTFIGGSSYFISTSTVLGEGGFGGAYGGTAGGGGSYVGDGGGNGGQGGAIYIAVHNVYGGPGAGGAGGYSGNGGNGGIGGTYFVSGFTNPTAGTAGSGGGGGGGGGGFDVLQSQYYLAALGSGGGGVGLQGQGGSGGGGVEATATWTYIPPQDGGPLYVNGDITQYQTGGGGGSGGTQPPITYNGAPTYTGSVNGGLYGGGAGGRYIRPTGVSMIGGGGAVRIIWGSGRAFPSTNTGNV